jgi:hypothetical protein
MTIVKAYPDIETEACSIADPRSRPNAFLLARAAESSDRKGEFEVLHVRLIRGQRILCSNYHGTGAEYQDGDRSRHNVCKA